MRSLAKRIKNISDRMLRKISDEVYEMMGHMESYTESCTAGISIFRKTGREMRHLKKEVRRRRSLNRCTPVKKRH